MTHAFIAFWKLHHGCKACIAVKGSHMCAKCRKLALVRWHRYVGERVTQGLCIQCPRPHKPNEQRCEPCAEQNRLRCLAWSRVHGKRRFAERKEAGVCVNHPKRQSAPGSCYCQPCRVRNRALRKGLYVPEKRPYKFLSLGA